jgi:hypothetical protein
MPSARDVEVTRWRGPTRRATGTSTARALHPRKGRCGDRRGGAENASSIISFIAFSIIARASSLTAQAHWSTACTEPLVYLPRVPLLVAPRRGSCVHPPFIMRLSFHLIARASPPTAQANWLAACTEPRPKYFPLYRSLPRYRRLQQCLSVGVSGQGPRNGPRAMFGHSCLVGRPRRAIEVQAGWARWRSGKYFPAYRCRQRPHPFALLCFGWLQPLPSLAP